MTRNYQIRVQQRTCRSTYWWILLSGMITIYTNKDYGTPRAAATAARRFANRHNLHTKSGVIYPQPREDTAS